METYKGPALVRFVNYGNLNRNGRQLPYKDIGLTLLLTGEKINGRIFLSKFLANNGNLVNVAVKIKETKKWGREIQKIYREEFITRNVIVQGLPASAFPGQNVEFPFRARLKPELDGEGNFMMNTPYGPVSTKNAVYKRARDKSTDYYE